MKSRTLLLIIGIKCIACICGAEEDSAARWIDRFAFKKPPVESSGICAGQIGRLPEFSVKPVSAGKHLVRVSLPFAPGALPSGLSLRVNVARESFPCDLRELTLHPGKPESVRRGIITFPFEFNEAAFTSFKLELDNRPHVETPKPKLDSNEFVVTLGSKTVKIARDRISYSTGDGAEWNAQLIAPARASGNQPVPEFIESGENFVWARLLVPDADWPRIIEIRLDSLGGLAVGAHLQRLGKEDATAPDLGWQISGQKLGLIVSRDGQTPFFMSEDGKTKATFPMMRFQQKGSVGFVENMGDSVGRYLRCAASENVPFQPTAWRSAELVISPTGETPRDALLNPVMEISIDPRDWDAAYRCGLNPDLKPWPAILQLGAFTREGIRKAVAVGDDFGNVTSFNYGSEHGGFYGMNRLNHAPSIFVEGWRSDDRKLREVGALWCSNMYDLSIWWGDNDKFGGTRYNAASAAGHKEHIEDRNFMWRTNNASTFCTKGIDTFLLAYEETGDPRMLASLRGQVEYARKYIHVNDGEARNIGDVVDYMHLYRLTGVAMYRDEALRLFRELREKLSTGDLFSQSGMPIVSEMEFINDDDMGYKYPFAKPYILGYALAGLPELLKDFPDEPKLRDVVRAVADFIAEAQDPVGGWRYPHPRSLNVLANQGIEHAMQICRAAEVLEARGEPIENLLDAIERTLQSRILTFDRTGKIFSGLNGWEQKAGVLKDGTTVNDLYKKPEDRDPARDYTEGAIGVGGAPPDGLVYFDQVLSFYLAHRPADRLLHANKEFQAVLDRMEKKSAETPLASDGIYEAAKLDYGVKAFLPSFSKARIQRMDFSLAWNDAKTSFPDWRATARDKYLECLLDAPLRAAFNAKVIATEDRGTYEARKIEFNLSTDYRVIGYLLVPKQSDGASKRYPAILALHDHGAHFSIGKEKVIRPFDVTPEKLADAQDWVTKYYGGNWIGDELANRGYVVFSTDALFWGDRGRAEGVDYKAQQALGANMLQQGQSWAGTIVWDDIRSAEFVQSLPEVDPSRIGCLGLSMGSHRTWSLAAATDIIKAGAAICWMGDTAGLMAEGNNQTVGQSSFSMLLPAIRNYLDYPDVASIACPKPMLFFNGDQDALFPVEGVKASYEKMHRVWRDQKVEDRLVTKLWPVPHLFNVEMQKEAFEFLDRNLKKN